MSGYVKEINFISSHLLWVHTDFIPSRPFIIAISSIHILFIISTVIAELLVKDLSYIL